MLKRKKREEEERPQKEEIQHISDSRCSFPPHPLFTPSGRGCYHGVHTNFNHVQIFSHSWPSELSFSPVSLAFVLVHLISTTLV